MEDKVKLIIGPMYSGKTSELLRDLSRYSELGKRVLYVNSSIDTRGKEFSTHNETLKGSKKISCIKLEKLEDGLQDMIQYDVIGIDEAQFFSDLVSSVEIIAETFEKKVIVAGLDSDFNRKPFQNVINLVSFAGKIDKLLSYCVECNKTNRERHAIFNHKIVRNNENTNIIVGGAETYVPLCRDCYRKCNGKNKELHATC